MPAIQGGLIFRIHAKTAEHNGKERAAWCAPCQADSKKQIRTNFDLRNSSDLFRLVTPAGIEPTPSP